MGRYLVTCTRHRVAVGASMVLRAARDIPKGSEVCHNYARSGSGGGGGGGGGEAGGEAGSEAGGEGEGENATPDGPGRRAFLTEHFNFDCGCASCGTAQKNVRHVPQNGSVFPVHTSLDLSFLIV